MIKRAARGRRGGSRGSGSGFAESIPDDIVRGPADGDDVGRPVAVEVAAPEILCGDVPVETVRSQFFLARS